MAKKMILGDGVKIRTTERLKEYWELPKVLAYYKDGTLVDWLMKDSGAEKEIKDKVNAIETEKITDAKEIAKRLCEAFGVPFDEASFVDLEELDKIKAREEKLRKITADEEIIKNIDKVAFDQKEMNELLDKGVKTIYLVNNKFYIDLDEENITYKGVGEAIAVIDSKKVVSFKALGIEFKDIVFDEEYAAILKTAEPNLEVAQSEQPISDIVARMIQVTEKCWNEYKNDLNGEMHLNYKDADLKRKIEEAFVVESPEALINDDETVALFIPHIQSLQCLLICKKGFYFVKSIIDDNPFLGFLGEATTVQKEEHKFVSWDNLIYTYYEPKNELLPSSLLTDDSSGDCIVLKHFDGKETKLATKINNAYLQSFMVTWINQLNDIYEVDNGIEPTERTKQMMTFLDEYKKTANDFLDGKVYLNGNIPKDKLNKAIALFTKMIPDKMIKRNEVVALYLSHFKYYALGHNGIGCSLNCILLTEQGFYFSKNPSGKVKERNEVEACFIPWTDFDGAWYYNKPGKYRYPHYVEIRFKKNGYYETKLIGTNETPNHHEGFCERFLIPLLYKFSGKEMYKC